MSPTSPTRTISHYRLLELLGRGAMGEVWLAEDTELPRKVAVKILPRHLESDPEAVKRLLHEASAVATVEHPHVVTIYEAGTADGRAYLVLQRVEGETLEERLARGPLEIEKAIELALQIADALAEVHALGIVHRDLKPSNVVLTARGPKILDFGIASVKGSPRLTQTGVAVGTPLAMSPEQMKGQPPDNRSDLWALGVMLYQALTGRHPFEGVSYEAVVHAVTNAQPALPSALRADVGPDLDYIVMKLLRKDPSHRYSRAEELIADLTSCEACVIDASRSRARMALPRLAVLPFEVMSANPDDSFLAEGLVEDLIVDLTRLGGLQVTSRADVLPYRDRVVPPRTLGRELGVDYVLLGSVRRAGNRARISTQLVRSSDGHALCAERFDRTLEDLFEVQAEVSKRIVETLQVALRPGELEMLRRAPTRDQEAYGFYLKARALLDVGTRDENRRAEELLKRALELDPRFALAHATLGECYALRGLRWWAGLEVVEQALPCAERALEIEPELLEAHVVCAMVHRLKGEIEPLFAALEPVRAMDPDHAQALEWAGWSYLSLGKPELALGIFERLVERHPEHFVAAGFLVSCLEMLGRTEDAARCARQSLERQLEFVRRHPDDVLGRAFLGIELIRSGEREAGIAQTERAIAMAPDDGRNRYNAACAFALAGLKERALEELQEGVRNLPSFISDWPRRDPDLASLRDDPEFIRLFGVAEPADAGRT